METSFWDTSTEMIRWPHLIWMPVTKKNKLRKMPQFLFSDALSLPWWNFKLYFSLNIYHILNDNKFALLWYKSNFFNPFSSISIVAGDELKRIVLAVVQQKICSHFLISLFWKVSIFLYSNNVFLNHLTIWNTHAYQVAIYWNWGVLTVSY